MCLVYLNPKNNVWAHCSVYLRKEEERQTPGHWDMLKMRSPGSNPALNPSKCIFGSPHCRHGAYWPVVFTYYLWLYWWSEIFLLQDLRRFICVHVSFFIIKRRQIPPFGKQVVHFITKDLGIGFPLGHTCSWACSQIRNLCEQGGCVVVKPLESSVPAMDGKSVQTPTFSGKIESTAATLPGFSLSQVLTLKQEGSEITFFHLFQGCVLGRCQER